ncbi:MAG: proline racemase family protein [Actinomycetota bacterium]|nr:proline racemase family protein [Actinomycetota bacterium]
MDEAIEVATTDYHTGGEPFRIVSDGVTPLPGATILDKRRYAAEHLDDIRKLLVNEPRGHADMYGCFLADPVDDEGDIGVVFFHNAGYSTACGHGTIALVTWALESGVLPITGAETEVVVDAPSGRLTTVARIEGSRVRSVRFTNVPSFVVAEGIQVQTGAGEVTLDISYGGAFYASVHAPEVGLAVQSSDLGALITLGREIKAAVEKEHDIVHPAEPQLRDVYGVIFFEASEPGVGALGQRNVTIFADGEVDRSPCGSGTSARLALLDKSGELPRGDTLEHTGIVDSVFSARVTGETEVEGIPAVITEVEGSAFISGHHQFVLDPEDPLGTGFLLR